jgi:hypothetical protein
MDEARDNSNGTSKSTRMSLRSMLKTFYSRELRSFAVVMWIWGIIFMAIAVIAGVLFCQAQETQPMIMYAGLFLVGVVGIALVKVLSWQMINRYELGKQIQKLEEKIDRLSSDKPQ